MGASTAAARLLNRRGQSQWSGETMTEAGTSEIGDRKDVRARGARSMKAYIIGLVGIAALAAAANVVYQRRTATDDARKAALADAQFSANVAAAELASGLTLVQTTVATTAATPGLEAVLAGPAPCQLQFGQSGLVNSGHIDVIGRDGTVGCSSADKPVTPVYADAPWLAKAMQAPVVLGPVVDARTGAQVLVVSSPFGGLGAVVVFIDLEKVGTQLSAELGGPRGLEFVVTDNSAGVVLTRSIDSGEWVGRSTAGTPFDVDSDQTPDHDVDGTARLYGSAAVEGQPWRIFAGANRSDALAAANRISDRQLAITMAGLVLLLAAAFVLYRRVARPITKLSAAVQEATAHRSAEPIAVNGPAEINDLVADFNRLIEVANNEIQAVSYTHLTLPTNREV